MSVSICKVIDAKSETLDVKHEKTFHSRFTSHVSHFTTGDKSYEEFNNFTYNIFMKRYCLALDLKNDAALIAEYENYHKQVWKEIIASIKDAGIEAMNIYRTGNRLFMIMEVNDDFSFEKKSAADLANEKVQEWEKLMWKFQQPLPWAKENEKWILMEDIFDLK
jgi:L-rhamnose mutarotase